MTNDHEGKKYSGPRMNAMINVKEIRLITEDGDNIGVVVTSDALDRAKNVALDLVEIVPNAEPPVCKIMDYGKHKYQEQKKLAEARKKQKTIETKEIKLRPNIETHDYDVKLRASRRFLEEGNKVKVTLRFRGREIAHSNLGLKLMQRFLEDNIDLAKIDQAPRMEGRIGLMILSAK
ncbi:MAG: translation initiation factor IF-3 [Alphaproteobacteria bacterium]|jgi:translation initiation factor IF-3